MTLIRHLVWHDLRSQRLVLAVWGVFLLVNTWLTLNAEGPDGRAFSGSLTWIRVLLVALVTSVVIQQDSLVGTSAFWRTRPIGRGTLLAGKATTLGLALIVLPGVITWLVWLRFGVFAGDAGVVAVGLLLENATIALLAAMAAVVTPSLTYLVVAGVAGGTMVSVINSVVLPSLVTTWPFVGLTLGRNVAVYLGTLFVLGVPAVVYQYLRLREWHTASLVALALLASTTLTRFWPAPLPPALPPVDHRVMNPQAVSLVVAPESVRRTEGLSGDRGAQEAMASYGVAVTAQGQPDDVSIVIDTIESRLLLKDRTELWSTQFWGGIPPADGWRNADHRAVKAALAPAAPPEPAAPRRGEAPVRSLSLMRLPVRLERPYAGQAARLTTGMNLFAQRLRVGAAVPSVQGALLRLPGGAARILAASADGHRVVLKIRTSRVETFPFDYRQQRPVFQRLHVRNLRTNEAWESRCAHARPLYITTVLGVSNIIASTGVMTCTFGPQGGGEPAPRLDAAWLADAELVALEYEMLGAFTKSIQVELVVGQSSGSPSR